MGINYRLHLSKAFDMALAWPMAKAEFRGLTYGLSLALTIDARTVKPSSFVNVYKNRSVVGSLMMLTDAIDDAVDGVHPSLLAGADFSHDDEGMCRFLHDRRFVPADYIPCLKSMAEAGLISLENAKGYSNLFCHMLRDRAEWQLKVEKGHLHHDRMQMVEGNLSFAGAFGCMFFGLLKPFTDEKMFLSGVDAQDMLSSAYPDVYALTRTTQYLDDLRDIMIDLVEEIELGVISPNVILSHALQTTKDYKDLYRFGRENKDRDVVPIEQTPFKLQEAIAKTGEAFQEEAMTVQSASLRAILSSFWRNTLKEGLKTMNHPEVARKHAIESQRASELNWS